MRLPRDFWLCILLGTVTVLASGCTVIKAVDKPWPVLPKPDRPNLNMYTMTFENPTEREQKLIADAHALVTYAKQLETGYAYYNTAARDHNEKVVEQMAEITKARELKPMAEVTVTGGTEVDTEK